MKYVELPTLEDSPERHSWGIFGEGDELGTLNWIGPDQVVDAARLVRAGKVFNLDLPLDVPGPLTPTRAEFVHHVESIRQGRDDWLDGFYLQCSTQWDGLQHIRYRRHGFYGGRQEADLDRDGSLGIDRVAEHGIVGRGVLLDVATYSEKNNPPWRPDTRTEVTTDLLDAVFEAEGVQSVKGDVLLIRTGWLRWFLGLTAKQRKAQPRTEEMDSVGLTPTVEMVAWLWDHQVAAIALDNPAVEVLPVRREQGFLHHRLVPLLGMVLGEFWDFERLAQDCLADGIYEGMFVASPLNLPRGVGSPGNGYLMK